MCNSPELCIGGKRERPVERDHHEDKNAPPLVSGIARPGEGCGEGVRCRSEAFSRPRAGGWKGALNGRLSRQIQRPYDPPAVTLLEALKAPGKAHDLLNRRSRGIVSTPLDSDRGGGVDFAVTLRG